MLHRSKLSIRIYEEKDREVILSLWSRCGLVRPVNDPSKDIDRKVATDPSGFLVGEVDGSVVATCMFGYEGHRAWINYLAVLPDQQGKGYAKALMLHAETLLRQAGCPKINLQVRSTNQKVLSFYQDLGFQQDDVLSLGKRLETDETP